jgi:hypothetical protein
MFSKLMFKLFHVKPKKIAFLDGDNPLPCILDAYVKHLRGVETHLVRTLRGEENPPKILSKSSEKINKIYLRGLTTGKETTDKFIGAYIQKAINDGYKEITVVSMDYDFIDIFKMAIMLNPQVTNVMFRIIVPAIANQQGKLYDSEVRGIDKISNISVVREQKTVDI